MKRVTFVCALLAVCLAAGADAQMRDFAVHKRGMLHQTVFNTGELGRAYDQGGGGSMAGAPSFEWPGNSGVIVDAVHYNGQYNSFGGGLYLGVSTPDTVARLYAFCGGAGSGSPEPVTGKYSFPISISRTENYPVLANGALNTAYNPDEAEEVIVSKWGTPTGLTVTRTSRAWSYPDYDDFIIYEYEIENTGDKDGDLSTVESNSTLTDVFVAYEYGLAPSMFGYERRFNRWNYADFENKDVRARFDRNRWLNYAIDADGKSDAKYFDAWSAQDVNGGGLLSPQAVGFSMLYYDTTHLAVKGETDIQVRSSDTLYVWDAHNHIKQPYLNRLETSNTRISKVTPYIDPAVARKNNPYSGSKVGLFGPDWIGRGSFNVRQSQYFAIGRILAFGPYTMRHGDKARFAVAEVAGYGAARVEETLAGLRDEGGSCGQNCGELPDSVFFTVPNWTSLITINGIQYGSTYLATHKLPSYVNSNTVTVREVTDRAIEAYTGTTVVNHDSAQYWPERSPDHGVYRVPMPVPAPGLAIRSNVKAQNEIAWSDAVESFTAPQLDAPLRNYEVYRAPHPLGPWSLMDSVGIRDARYYQGGTYTVVDSSTKVGESFYYTVVTVNTKGMRSGKTNLKLFETALGAAKELGKVYVVPNPFIVRSGFSGATGGSTTTAGGEAENRISFYNLPTPCTIRIFSYSGQLVTTLDHREDRSYHHWYQVTDNNQKIAPGVYFFVVETPDGKKSNGKFVVIR